MSLNFVVGDTEKHSLIFGYDRFFGRVSLFIDRNHRVAEDTA